MSRWLFAFALTQALEVPLLVRAVPGSRLRRLAIAFGASAITHPLLWFAWSRWVPWAYWPRTLAGELLVVAIEAAWLARFGARDALLWALLANAFSAGVGFLWVGLWGWPV